MNGIPGPSCGIARLQTMFKESLSDMPTLIISLQADHNLDPAEGLSFKSTIPWKFGFDFDFNQGIMSHRRGTCLIFTRHKPPEFYKGYVGAGSPEHELKEDKNVNANRFKDLESEKVVRMNYGDVKLWRLAAVGSKE